VANPIRRKLEPGIYERTDDDGQRLGLEIYYKDAENKPRRRAVGGDIHDARDALAKARVRRTRREREPDDPRRTFGTVANAFEATHVATLRPNSQAIRKAGLRRLREQFGAKRMTAISRTDVRAFIAAEVKEGLKANTIASHLATLSSVFTFARDDLDMPVSMPRLKPKEKPNPADDAREHRILTDSELEVVLAACDPRTRLFFRTLAETGARKSEGLGLLARRVDEGTITFREQLDEAGDLVPLKFPTSRRTIEVTYALSGELIATGTGRVFAFTHNEVDHAWQKARKGLADPLPTIHDLRHSHVSALIADGWDPQEIADRIGDKLQTVLAVYAHAFDVQRRGQERRRRLEGRYGARDGYPMATDGYQPADVPSRGVSHESLQSD
jgi:integrase